jgi:hypothetical protein
MSRIFILRDICQTKPQVQSQAKKCILKAISTCQDPRILSAEWVIWYVSTCI